MFFRARIAQFYGWTHHYIEQLDYVTLLEYYEAITVIEARESIVGMRIADYPHLKDDARRKIYRDFNRLAFPQGQNVQEVSTKQLARMLNGQ